MLQISVYVRTAQRSASTSTLSMAFHVQWVCGQIGIRAAGYIRKLANVARQLSAQFVDARRQRLEMIAVLGNSPGL